jgi:hypothetical protein
MEWEMDKHEDDKIASIPRRCSMTSDLAGTARVGSFGCSMVEIVRSTD